MVRSHCASVIPPTGTSSGIQIPALATNRSTPPSSTRQRSKSISAPQGVDTSLACANARTPTARAASTTVRASASRLW